MFADFVRAGPTMSWIMFDDGFACAADIKAARAVGASQPRSLYRPDVDVT
jgi:hypothetical protein